MTAPAADYFAQFEAPAESRSARYTTKRSRYGWYLGLPDPPGFKFDKRGIPNITTVAGTMTDSYALTQWKLRKAIEGIKRNPALLGAIPDRGDFDFESEDGKRIVEGVVANALELAGANQGADSGTRFHELTERVDAGEDPAAIARTMTDNEKRMMRAYLRVREEEGLTTAPGMIERIVFNAALGACGTLDRIVIKDGVWLIDDLKTQKSSPKLYEHIKIPVQEASYAHSDFMLDPYEMKWIPMPEVSKRVAVITWVPVNDPGYAEIFKVNVTDGWEMALHSDVVRGHRKRKDVISSIRKFRG